MNRMDAVCPTSDGKRHVWRFPGKGMVFPILFWGGVWGFAEATLGFVLHRAAIALPGLPGFVMFPIACLWMARAIRTTRHPAAAFGAACVAACVKLLDFLLPGAIPLRILNPAASLLLEGLVVWGVVAWTWRRERAVRWPQMLAMAFGWRVLFLLDMLLLASLSLPAALWTDGPGITLRFLLLESAVNAALMAGGTWALRRMAVRSAAGSGSVAGSDDQEAVRGYMKGEAPCPVHAGWAWMALGAAIAAQLLL